MNLQIRRLLFVISLIGILISITILFLGMRAVMGVGGACAEGGAYQIAVHCPENTAAMVPLSIVLGLILVFVYAGLAEKDGPDISLLFWSGLFLSLGWNFFEFAIYPPAPGSTFGWWLCGIVFFIMGLGPIPMLGLKGLVSAFLGSHPPTSTETAVTATQSSRWLVAIHTLVIPVGIYIGWSLYNFLASI